MSEIVPARTDPAALAPANAGTMADLLHFAVEKGTPVESLERLVALQERILDRNAAAEFFAAMAEFQRRCPPIKKSSTAKFNTKSGGTASYTYAELDEIARTVTPILASVGLSYTWDSSVVDGVLVVTCTVRHRGGHSTTAKFGSKIEGSPLMSGHQATAATLTFGRRQSLVQALGLTTTDDDLDGRDLSSRDGGAAESPGDFITQEQAANLKAIFDEIDPSGGEERRCKAALHIDYLDRMPAKAYRNALTVAEAKRRKA